MECEVCGKPIERPVQVKIEGNIYSVCEECAHLGRRLKISTHDASKERILGLEIPELIDNFNHIIREYRERLSLSLEDLAQRIGEKASVLKRIEEGKLEPTFEIVSKLERFFEIELHKKKE